MIKINYINIKEPINIQWTPINMQNTVEVYFNLNRITMATEFNDFYILKIFRKNGTRYDFGDVKTSRKKLAKLKYLHEQNK